VGLVRIALLFGFIAAAFAMILVPIADEQSRAYSERAAHSVGIDSFKTGTIGRQETYTIRRSVLQPSPNSICIIRDSRRSGNC
jgi:lipopolysaccharide export LptBFGC system permease protein LptF